MRWSKLGIIAGAGALPVSLAQACASRSAPCHVIRLAGIADGFDPAGGATLWGVEECGLGEAGKLIRLLKNAECDAVVMAGIVQRPDFSKLSLDWRGAALLPRVMAGAAKGDGALLSVLVETLEAEGFKVIGADEVAQGLTVEAGALGAHAPAAGHLQDIEKAASVVEALGRFDVGQGAVVANGLVLAIEAAEGTDKMLERCVQLPAVLRGEKNTGVLVKRPKPGQELRVDLPTIGVQTIELAIAAGLAGVAIEAGRALLMDRDAAIHAADDAGLFIYGFDLAEIASL